MKGNTRKVTSLGGVLNLLRQLMSADLPLGLTAAVSAADAAIQKKFFGSRATFLIISNKEMGDTTKIVESLEESGLLIIGVSETIQKITQNNKKADFLECYKVSYLLVY